MVSVRPCCLSPLDFGDVTKLRLLPRQRSAVCGVSAMITGLRCSAGFFSSRFTETSFVSQYIPSCLINTLNQFCAYVSARCCRKYVPQGAAPAPFCVRPDTVARLYALTRGEGHTEGLISGVK